MHVVENEYSILFQVTYVSETWTDTAATVCNMDAAAMATDEKVWQRA